MWHWRLTLIALLAAAGCKGAGVGPKVDNPVIGPPPPRRVGAANVDSAARIARQQREASDQNREGGVELTGLVEAETALPPGLEGNRVVATVNGAPIFEAEILERYAEPLAKIRAQSEDQYRRQADMLIARDLRTHVERTLLSEAMNRSLKKEQQKQLDGFIKKQLQTQYEEMKKDLKVTSTAELDRALQERGTSLAMVEHQFRNKVLAQQYLASKVKTGPKLSRQDLRFYYQQHLKDYEIKRRVRWQQILISRANEEQARAKLRKVSDGLLQKPPRDFGEMAAELSDGPKAAEKGIYDWTSEGSLADSKLESLLFELPIGQPSDLIETPSYFQIVRVLERQNADHVPFDEVQDAIREKLQKAHEQAEIAKIIDELWATAVIESPYEIKGYEPKDLDSVEN
jgi:parvulin-like peptidyl-prolyl isomerase